ncbi:pentatricopeptide repeat-containing protein At5g39710-like [Rosa rugosa]|uniref:pentatricopeptide repeat-containing protein At5g39710-like n=1 Tax=Rosa rugosa TaxID=74645 RepID=UPI002B412B3C|nr:pentatricopeptide repeat-containing protein At5g39710-like [Rosa rugosa]
MTEGYFQEAKEFMAHVKNGYVPMILTLTGMMEEYADAGRTKDALIVYRMMEDNKCAANRPNAYTYSVIIKALVKDKDPDFLGVAKECVMEMMGRGMQPNAGTYVAVSEGFVEKEKAEEGRELVEVMKAKGFVADKKAVREVLKGQRGVLVDKVIKMVFGVFGL